MDSLILSPSYTTTDNSHVLVLGSCRSGKTRDFVKPNLLKLTDSVIVIGRDNDGLVEDTAPFRRETLKQQIYDKNQWDGAILNNKPKSTAYLLASVHSKEELKDVSYYGNVHLQVFGLGRELNPITVIIDDISLFDINKETLLRCLTNGLANNIRIIITVQSINQLKQKYGNESTKEILNNCNTKLIFNVNDPADADYISKLSNGIFFHRRNSANE